MKLSLFKNLIACVLLLTAFAPAFFAQDASENQEEVKQNTQTLGENERLPFMRTEDSAANSEPGSGGLLIRTLGAMLLIVGLIFFGAWGLKKLGFGNLKSNSAENAPDLTILSSVSMGSGRTISTVRFGERILLVGSTAQSFTLLADDTEDEPVSKIQPRSVAEMLAEESENDFASELAQAEMNFDVWNKKGEQI